MPDIPITDLTPSMLNHWKTRALQAEAELERLRAGIRELRVGYKSWPTVFRELGRLLERPDA